MMHPLDSLAEIRLLEHGRQTAASLRNAARRRAAEKPATSRLARFQAWLGIGASSTSRDRPCDSGATPHAGRA